MSKYIENLIKQLEGKNIKQFTKHAQASQDLSNILKDQHEVKRQLKVKKEIQKLLRR